MKCKNYHKTIIKFYLIINYHKIETIDISFLISDLIKIINSDVTPKFIITLDSIDLIRYEESIKATKAIQSD